MYHHVAASAVQTLAVYQMRIQVRDLVHRCRQDGTHRCDLQLLECNSKLFAISCHSLELS